MLVKLAETCTMTDYEDRPTDMDAIFNHIGDDIISEHIFEHPLEQSECHQKGCFEDATKPRIFELLKDNTY